MGGEGGAQLQAESGLLEGQQSPPALEQLGRLLRGEDARLGALRRAQHRKHRSPVGERGGGLLGIH